MVKYDVPLDLDHNANLNELVKQIRPNSVVMEFGPSTGRLTAYLKNKLNCQVYIVEIDKEAFDICKQYSVNGVCDDIETYTWKKMAQGVVFDYVIFADVLEHLKNPRHLIEELKDFIDEKTRILVSVPNITHNAVVLQLLNQRFDYQNTGLLDNTHIHFFTKETIKEMFEEAGYNMVSWNGTVAEPYNTELKMNFEHLPQSVIDYLSTRDYGNLYQIICEFSLGDVTEYRDEIISTKSREYFAKIFFDYTGKGFREEQSSYITIDLSDEIVNLSLPISKDEHQYVNKIAINPLDNYWSATSIVEIRVDDLIIMPDYSLEGVLVGCEDASNISRDLKYVIPIDKKVRVIDIKYRCKKLYIDDAFCKLYKEYLNANHQYKVSKEEHEVSKVEHRSLKEQHKSLKEEYEMLLEVKKSEHIQHIKMDSERIAMLEQMCKRNISLKNDAADLERRSKTFNLLRRNRKISYDIKVYNKKQYHPFVYYKKDFAFSSVEQYVAALSSDYVIVSFLETDLTETLYNYITRMELNHLVYYFDSTSQGAINCKTDFSIDYLMNNNCEFDVMLINTDLLKIILSEYSFDAIDNSRELMLLISKYTTDIKHVSEVMYDVSQNQEHNLSQNIVDNILQYRYLGHAIYDGEQVNFDYIQSNPKVSIIIPTKDGVNMLSPCIESIVEKSSYSNYEILILNNNSEKKETFDWFSEIQRTCKSVRVIDALFEFNWSKLNNYGIKHATGDVYIFLNNDTLIKSHNWIERLVENAMRPDAGVVGGLLLYEDETIQHAGVVIGMTDFADHIYKGEDVDCDVKCFPTPLQKRNVSAVTGACMAIAKHTIEKIGEFNEEFIICGSDIEICLRAYKYGLVNIYEPSAVLYHLESKTRDSYIPEIDFYLSSIHYEPFKSQGDPFYSKKLDYKKTTPVLK